MSNYESQGKLHRAIRMKREYGSIYLLKRIIDSIYERTIASLRRAGRAEAIFKLSTREERFSLVYNENYWGNLESRSGTGSTLEASARFRSEFEIFLNDQHVTSIFDAPCGDWNWMQHVQLPPEVTYIGGDIVPALIQSLKSQFSAPNISFLKFDIVVDKFPSVYAWLCRDCLFHLSNEDIISALKNFCTSEVQFALITNHYGLANNKDIKTGDFRSLDLQLEPFNLPAPTAILKEQVSTEKKHVAVWSREQISNALNHSINSQDITTQQAASR